MLEWWPVEMVVAAAVVGRDPVRVLHRRRRQTGYSSPHPTLLTVTQTGEGTSKTTTTYSDKGQWDSIFPEGLAPRKTSDHFHKGRCIHSPVHKL